MKTKEEARKSMMFIQKEDYNFIVYNLLILLDELGCISPQKKFRDFRKIAFIIDFISANKSISSFNQDELSTIFVNSQLVKVKLLSHILIVIKRKNYLGVSVNETHKSFDIWLEKDNIPSTFWNTNFFENEKGNIAQIKKEVYGLSTTTSETLIQKLFTSKNVMTWLI